MDTTKIFLKVLLKHNYILILSLFCVQSISVFPYYWEN